MNTVLHQKNIMKAWRNNRQLWLSRIQIRGSLFVYIECVYQDTYGAYIYSQSENRHFLRNALLPLSIYPVCQKFYNLLEYVRAMKEHLLRFSCFTYVGGIYKMSCAGSIVWSAALALSFEPDACNLNFIKTAHLVKLGNRLGVFLATYILCR